MGKIDNPTRRPKPYSKTKNRLSPAKLKTLKPGWHHDGGGLYFRVCGNKDGTIGSRSWVFRYKPKGWTSNRDLGIGPWPKIKLKHAREQRDNVYGPRWNGGKGTDPIEFRRQERREEEADARLTEMTFMRAFEQHKKTEPDAPKWREWDKAFNKHVAKNRQWAGVPVARITAKMIIDLLDPLWNTRTAQAKALLARIAKVLDWATAHKYRRNPDDSEMDNPARSATVKMYFKNRGKKKKSHPSLPYSRIKEFMDALSQKGGMAPLAFRFIILTGGRLTEGTQARWDEINFKQRIWTLPEDRMKMDRIHIVPLSNRAMAILTKLKKQQWNEWCFPTDRKDGFPLSQSGLRSVLRDLNKEQDKQDKPAWIDPTQNKRITIHGFRATFRTWAADQGYPDDVAEKALAHVPGDSTVQSYERSQMRERRRKLMADWANYCTGQPQQEKVV